VRVDLKRAGWVAIVLLVLVWGGLSALSVWAALTQQGTAGRVVGFAFAAFFALPLVGVLLNARKLRQPRGFAFDERGWRVWRGGDEVLVPWSEIGGLGIGYEAPPDIPSITIEGILKDAIVEQLIKDRRRVALEVYPAEVAGAYDMLKPDRIELAPPYPGLAGVRWSIPLPPGVVRTTAAAPRGSGASAGAAGTSGRGRRRDALPPSQTRRSGVASRYGMSGAHQPGCRAVPRRHHRDRRQRRPHRQRPRRQADHVLQPVGVAAA
jgi:hypothetical protein